MMNQNTPRRAMPCFWDRSDDPTISDPCPNRAGDEIYWDGEYQPCCPTCMPHAKAARNEILANIDEHYWS